MLFTSAIVGHLLHCSLAHAEHVPIIDMHWHAFGWDHNGDPPPAHEISGRPPEAMSDEEALVDTPREVERCGTVLLGLASGPLDPVLRSRQAAPDLFVSDAYAGPR